MSIAAARARVSAVLPRAVAAAILLACGHAFGQPLEPEAYPPPEPPLPFAQGTSMGGLVFGFGQSAGQTRFTFGGSYGYFVLNGLAPGLSTLVTTGSGPATLELTPFIRFIPLRLLPVSPMLVVQGGRLFIEDFDDLWVFGGGGGLIYFAAPRISFTVQVIYEQFFPDSVCGLDCSRVLVSGGAGVSF